MRRLVMLACLAAISMPALQFRSVHAQTDSPATPDLTETTSPSADLSLPGVAAEEPRTRTVLDTLIDGGVVGLLIGLLSMVAVGCVVEHAMSIRKSVLMPDHVLNDLEGMVAAGEIDNSIEYCQQPENVCLVSHVILAGLERFKVAHFGFAEYKSAVEEAGEEQTGRLYRRTEILGLIGAIAPMLGLTGTVLGMINAFNTIAATKGMAKPEQLAGSIGQALVTTLLGLIVAIPAMIAVSYFRNKIDSIIAEAGKRIERVLMPLGRQQ